MSKIDKSVLGVAGEFAVAAELCRRNIYAQPTFGHQKRMDLLAFGPGGRMLRLEVKAKQGQEWPNCHGISGLDTFLVFVDFAGRLAAERPDFYILFSSEWRDTAMAAINRYKAKHPERRAVITDEGLVRLPDEVNAQGHEYVVCGVRPEHIAGHKEAWQKIAEALQARSEFVRAVGAPEPALQDRSDCDADEAGET